MAATTKTVGNANMRIWNEVCTTPETATKKFNRGMFKGTDINPQYRWETLTKVFGPAGQGWGTQDETFEYQHLDNGEALIFVRLRIWYVLDGERHVTPIGMSGGFMRKHVGRDHNARTINDDECWKKAYTDALGNAARFLGVVADVYLGLYDDSKYVNDRRQEAREERAQAEKVKKSSFQQCSPIPAATAEASNARMGQGWRDWQETATSKIGECASMDDLRATKQELDPAYKACPLPNVRARIVEAIQQKKSELTEAA